MASGSQPFSNEQMRRTWATLDILTSFKRRTNRPPPTAELIRRKFDDLSLPALDTLSILVDHTIEEQHGRLGPRQVGGMARAVRVFPEDTASEVAHVHACGNVASAAAVKRASYEASHAFRVGLEHLAEARKRGIPLCPIPTDLHTHAMIALANGDGDSKNTALKILGVGDATVQENGSFVSSKGLLTGTAFCIVVMDRLHLPADICCGSCHRIVSGNDITICRRCGDHIACKGCLGHAQHLSECGRVRSKVRCMARSLTPHIRESVCRVAVVQLSSSGLMAPVLTTSIACSLIPSSLCEALSRCSTVVSPSELQVYWSLLISFLAHQDGDEQESIEYERLHYIQAANRDTVVEPQPNVPTSKGPKLLPSERRRIQKERRAKEKRDKEEIRAAAESAAMAEADAVLERQSARPNATSAILTSVLAKRESAASTEVVARVRARRDSLKADERRARKPDKMRAERKPTERVPDALLAAVLHIQQHARAWLRRRTKARRKQRSRAAKHIQSSVRTWLLSIDTPPVISSIPATGVESGNEGDGEDQSLCVVCLERPRVVLFLTCAHLCACEACAPLMHACPLCRAEGATLRVYT